MSRKQDEIDKFMREVAEENIKLKGELERIKKYERFVKHIYSHIKDVDRTSALPIDDWVMCKICNKTINQINKGDLNNANITKW